MVNTRSRFNRESRIEQSGTSSYSDNEDNMSVADHFGENILENETENDMREIERDHENHRFEQRFLEMNRQIGELTSIVKALTDRLSNSREENNRDVLNSETSARSDSCFIKQVTTFMVIERVHPIPMETRREVYFTVELLKHLSRQI